MPATSLDLSQIKTDALSTASSFRSLIGLGTLATQSANIADYLTIASAASTFQPLDSDLTSIAALSTTSFGRGLLTESSATTARTTLGLGSSAVLNAGSANGVATLGTDSKLTAAQIPDISLISYLGSVASQAAMLALSGQQGDWCVRSDLSTTWVITGSDPTLLANWTQLSYPSVPVQSVFGRTGNVVGVSTDYSSVGITNTAIGASNPSTGAFTTLSTTGRITTPSILLSGNFSATAWTTNGVGLSHTARTLTDTSSTGTVATAYTNVLGGNTIAASNATTFTDYASLFLGSPTAGSNVTITNPFSLITEGAVRIGGQLSLIQGTANTSVVTSTGYSLTGSNAQSLMDLSGTWNTTGTPTLIKANVTDTASNAASLLMDLQVGGSSRFRVQKDGRLIGNSWGITNDAGFTRIDDGSSGTRLALLSNSQFQLQSQTWFIDSSASSIDFSTAGTRSFVFSPTSNIFQLRRTTNAQVLQVYNTFTDASNYERGQLAWESNEWRIGSAAAGTGTQRNLVLGSWNSSGSWSPGLTLTPAGTATIATSLRIANSNISYENTRIWTSNAFQIISVNGSNWDTELHAGYWNPTLLKYVGTLRSLKTFAFSCGEEFVWLAGNAYSSSYTGSNHIARLEQTGNFSLNQTWNNAATTFTGILANVTDTASNANSLLMDLQVGGTSRFSVRKDGSYSVPLAAQAIFGAVSPYGMWQGFNGSLYFGTPPSTTHLAMDANGFYLRSTGGLRWSTSATDPYATGLALFADANDTLAQRRSTNPQVHRIYNTFTDASNYERGKIEWSSNVLRIGTEKAGTGSARALELQTDGVTRLTIASTGAVTFSGNVSMPASSQLSWGAFTILQAFLGHTYLDSPTSGEIYLRPGGGTIRLTANATGVAITGQLSISAINLVTDTTTGTKIGTATTQKLGFYNATPVVQPTAVADATDAASVITQLNALLSRMRDLGLIAT